MVKECWVNLGFPGVDWFSKRMLVGDSGVTSGNDAGADEEVEVAIAVEVGGGDGGAGVVKFGEGVGGVSEVAFSVVEVESVGEGGRVGGGFDGAGGDEEVGVAIGVGVEEEGAEVFGVEVFLEFLDGGGGEGAVGLAEVDAAGAVGGAAEVVVFVAVAVDVGDGDGATELGVLEGEEGLAGEVVVGFFGEADAGEVAGAGEGVGFEGFGEGCFFTGVGEGMGFVQGWI